MCMSFRESKMSDTILFAGEAEKNGKHVHVLAYQNSAESSGPNAMILPFPTNVSMGPDNIIDTRGFKNFLRNITDASKQVTKGMRFSRGLTLGAKSFDMREAQVFDVGSYTVILADHVDQVPAALMRVPQNKRPHVGVDFLSGFGKLYPNSPVALCCWAGSLEAEPLLWWYEPRVTDTLFVPTMDAHDGKAPRMDTMVYTDHIVSVGAVGPTTGNRVRYQDNIPTEVMDLLPSHVYGSRLPARLPNGDVLVKTANLHKDDRYTGPTWIRGDRSGQLSWWD